MLSCLLTKPSRCVFNEGFNTSPWTVNDGDNPPCPTAKAFMMVQSKFSGCLFFPSFLPPPPPLCLPGLKWPGRFTPMTIIVQLRDNSKLVLPLETSDPIISTACDMVNATSGFYNEDGQEEVTQRSRPSRKDKHNATDMMAKRTPPPPQQWKWAMHDLPEGANICKGRRYRHTYQSPIFHILSRVLHFTYPNRLTHSCAPHSTHRPNIARPTILLTGRDRQTVRETEKQTDK